MVFAVANVLSADSRVVLYPTIANGATTPHQCQFPLLNSPPDWPPQEAIGYSKGAPTPVQEDMVSEEVQKAPKDWGWGSDCPGHGPQGRGALRGPSREHRPLYCWSS